MRFALLTALLAATAPGPALASAPPPWVVPVLRLVSETHVQPVTGIVLPGGERVLVPAEFAAPGDEVVVLDGGTDIVRHGRPARLDRTFPQHGLEVLVVPGLQRAGAPLAPAMPAERSGVRLAAFPPAEQIAEGQPPVDWRGALQPLPGGQSVAFSGSERPNVTGALLDDCDNLLGISLAAGLPTLAPSDSTSYRWQQDLAAIWSELGLPVTGRACAPENPEAASETAAEPSPPAREQAEDPVTEPPQAEDKTPAGPETPTSGPATEPATEPEPEPEPEAQVGLPTELPPAEAPEPGTAGDPPLAAEPPRNALWGLLALLLIAAGLGVHLLRRRLAAPPARTSGESGHAPSEPGEARELQVEESPARAADSVLILSGRYADGRPLEHRVAVNPAMIRLVIGRGGADVLLDSEAVSRRHARLEGAADSLTLSDLGSGNGTSVDGVPCLEGEVFFLEPGASIVLADARFTVELSTDSEGEAP